MANNNEVRATAKYVRMAPRKVRMVVDTIRNKSVEQALEVLQFSTRAAAEPVGRLIWPVIKSRTPACLLGRRHTCYRFFRLGSMSCFLSC